MKFLLRLAGWIDATPAAWFGGAIAAVPVATDPATASIAVKTAILPIRIALTTVSPSEMDQRLERLQELIDSQQSAFNKAAIGSTVDVLFERPARKDGQIVGRTAFLQPAHVMASPDIIGQILPVRIDSLERYSFLGELAMARVPALSPIATGA